MKRSFLAGYFSKADLLVIEKMVGAAEKKSSGEIRVKIIRLCDKDLAGDSRAQAVREFNREGLHRTRDKTGVLILIILGENKFEILADKGIYFKIRQSELQQLVSAMSKDFRAGRFRLGVLRAVERVGNKLAEHFPRKADDTDELTDKVSVGGSR